MPNLFGLNVDFTPGYSGTDALNQIYNLKGWGGIPQGLAGAAGFIKDVADPNVDLVKGVGVNDWNGQRSSVAPTTSTATNNQPQYNPIAEGWNQNGGVGGSGSYAGGGGTSSAPTSDAATAAYYQQMMDQLNGQNGRLDSQLNTGLGNISNSYNTQANRLNEQKGVAQRNFDTSTQQNMQGYSNTRNGIMNNTRATANALQRLLGLNGAGNSSAALEQAPYAAGLQGSQNLNEAQQNYSTNMTGLKNSWEDTQRTFKNNFEDLNNQKYQQENSLRSTIAQTRANLLDQIANAGVNKSLALGQNFAQAQAARTPYQDKINSLLDSIAGLGNQYANPVMKTGDVTFKTPQLGQFSLGDQASIQNQTGGAGNLDPTFVNLLGLNKDKNKGLLG